MSVHLGLCVKCATTRDDCVETNIGSVCKPCFQASITAKTPGETLFSLTDPERRVHVLVWPPKPGSIMGPIELVTVAGTIYAFTRREDAEKSLKHFATGKDPELAAVRVTEVTAQYLIRYALSTPGVRVVGVDGLREDASEASPG